ncbi:MAG: hypothetical protein IIC89_06690 [Chloroflexi bacterium]|nr:hypothetical protein [Chloroflexota bacterium]
MLGLSRILLFVAPAALLALVALLAGCNGDGDGGPTATEQPQATATAGPAVTLDISSEDLTEQPGLSEFLASTGGVVDPSRNQYADLTGSGADEAVVSVSSGGEGGDIAIFVFGYGAGGELEELLRALPAESSILATIEDRQLKTTEGVRAPGDIGVPSQLLHRYYIWDGSALVIDREEREPA